MTKYTYDANANVTQVERQANAGGTQWQTAQFTYDILNNLTTVTDPLNRVTTYTYDNNGNVTSVVDANNNTTTYQYDERDLLFQVTDANSPAGVTQYDYDLNGKLATIYDAKGNPTNYTYDGFDRLTTKTYADTSTAQYAYDKNSNLTNVTPASTEQVQYVYDALNRMTAKNFPSHTTLNTTYGYDVGSHLLTANNAASQISYTYDVLNNVQTVTQQLGSLSPLTLTYGYDSAGNRTQVIYPSGKTVDYVYDANDRLQQVRVGGTALTNYTYDTLDRRTQKDLLGAVTQRSAYTLDLANQLSNVTNSIVGGGTISQYGYTFDNVGNRLTMNANGSTHNYSYNNIYELTGVSGAQTHSFAYDNVANRTTADTVNYTSNNVNQYTQVGGVTPTYDANGNLTTDGSRTLTYDEENRLKTAQYSGNSSSYTYDGFNRRVSKTVNGVTKYFLQDGDDVVAEYTSAGALAAEYVHGSRIDEVLTMDRGGTRYYYHYDGLGSVTQVTNGAGSVAESYTYDVYGQPSVTSSLIGNPYRFTGREFDEESGLYHYRARAYSPTLGRFLQRDPIGYFDSMNLFQYVRNNPANFVDPLGLQTGTLPSGTLGQLAALLAALADLLGGGFCPTLTPAQLGLLAILALLAALNFLAKAKAQPKAKDKEKDKTENEGGDYFRHWTSQEGKRNILGDGYINMSTRADPQHGPGVYLTTPNVSASTVDATSGETYVDVWVPNTVYNSPFFVKKPPEYVYTPGPYPIYNDPAHPPIPGP